MCVPASSLQLLFLIVVITFTFFLLSSLVTAGRRIAGDKRHRGRGAVYLKVGGGQRREELFIYCPLLKEAWKYLLGNIGKAFFTIF
jgi:hypothetical protein